MGRKTKLTAEYFPHYVADSPSINILEKHWGNDGYTFWFKLLGLLCKTPGHSYTCSTFAQKEFLSSQTRVETEVAMKIIDMLVDLENLDRDLWEQKKVIWCDNLIENLSSLYDKRTTKPEKPKINDFDPENSQQ